MDFPSDYEKRTEGLLRSRRTHIDLYLSNEPGPRNERGLRYTYVDETLDNEYEKGGIDAVKSMLHLVVQGLVDQAVDAMVDDYRRAADARLAQERKSKMGPLGFITDVAVAIHEKRTGRTDRGRNQG